MKDRVLKFGGEPGEANALGSQGCPDLEPESERNMLYTCPRW